MTKKHLKRLNMPNTWDVKKKGLTYIKRPLPGPHGFDHGQALSVVMRDMLGIAQTNKEVKNILHNHEVMVDGIKRTEVKFPVGLMDTITIPAIKESYRIILNKKGKLDSIKIDEKDAGLKVIRINGKTMSKKGLQLNLADGKNVLADKTESKVGDSLLIEVPKNIIKDVLKLEKGSLVMITGGKYTGIIANVSDIKTKTMTCKTKDGEFETSKKYAYVVGKDKPMVKIEE